MDTPPPLPTPDSTQPAPVPTLSYGQAEMPRIQFPPQGPPHATIGLLMVLIGTGMLLSRHVLLPLVALACMAAPSGAVLVFLGVMICIRGIHRPAGHARWPAAIAIPIALVAMIDALILLALVVTGKLEGL